MMFSTHEKPFEDVATLFKGLIRFALQILPYKCQFCKDHLACMGLILMLKDVKPSYTVMGEKYEGILKLKLPKYVKDCKSEKSPHNMSYRKRNPNVKKLMNFKKTFIQIMELLITLLGLHMPAANANFRIEKLIQT